MAGPGRPKKEEEKSDFLMKNKPSYVTRVQFLHREQKRVDGAIETIQKYYNPHVIVLVNPSKMNDGMVHDYIITVTGDEEEVVKNAFDHLNKLFA